MRESIRYNNINNLLQNFNVNYHDENGVTALHRTMDYYNSHVAEKLIEAGADVNLQDVLGGTVISRAVSLNDVTLVKKMIDAGANVNLKSKEYGWTPLHAAAYNTDPYGANSKQNKTSIINYLFKAGADVNAVNVDNETPLHLAVKGVNRIAVQLLLQHPEIDILVKDKNGNTALDVAQEFKKFNANDETQQIYRDLLLFSKTLKRITLDYIRNNRDQFSQEAIANLPADLQEQLNN